ncbi:hypothetical protein BC832DRAFT_132643 [Gaertneriomyces semiglobifer]|nr:hypothetical protein BC832DRAFT_132643 [Gaertneriomyces semiglobifer]
MEYLSPAPVPMTPGFYPHGGLGLDYGHGYHHHQLSQVALSHHEEQIAAQQQQVIAQQQRLFEQHHQQQQQQQQQQRQQLAHQLYQHQLLQQQQHQQELLAAYQSKATAASLPSPTASASSSETADTPQVTSKQQQQQQVKFRDFVTVAYTFSAEEYDRSSTPVPPLTKQDLIDLLLYRAEMQQVTRRLVMERKRLLAFQHYSGDMSRTAAVGLPSAPLTPPPPPASTAGGGYVDQQHAAHVPATTFGVDPTAWFGYPSPPVFAYPPAAGSTSPYAHNMNMMNMNRVPTSVYY